MKDTIGRMQVAASETGDACSPLAQSLDRLAVSAAGMARDHDEGPLVTALATLAALT